MPEQPTPAFESVLFPGSAPAPTAFAETQPDCFHDLNLDQILATLNAGREEYELAPIYYSTLADLEAITYRQAVYTDLEQEDVHAHVTAFATELRRQRAIIEGIKKLHAPLQKQFWYLDAMLTYQHGVQAFADALATDSLRSAGMLAFRDWLNHYVQSPAFTSFAVEGESIRGRLDAIRFTTHIEGPRVIVEPFADQSDYSAEVEATFARFRQGDVKSHLVSFHETQWLDTVEERIIDLVAALNTEEFSALEHYVVQHHETFVDPVIARADRELQFYLAYLEHVSRLKQGGLTFSMPTVSHDKAFQAEDFFDLALAGKLAAEKKPVVTNSLQMEADERLIVVTGANQGGKTTFSRTFGQIHWLANLGLPVPGRSARVFCFDRLFTHYEKEEDVHTLHGKLEDELVRIHEILQDATGHSVIIMNEIFNSTTLDDAILLGTAVLKEIISRDILAVCVTFIDELTTLSDTTVSMVAAVDPNAPAARTFRLVRKPADGLAYAMALAALHGLSHDRITERIGS